MKQCGFRVLQALDGAEAIRIAESAVPDLILMDTSLPYVDGLQATQGIRKIGCLHNVPIIFLSAHAQPEARQAALAIGGNEYLVKPLNLEELELEVRKQLANKGALRMKLLRKVYAQQLAS
jgi:DNA-binding response OmpR family regulator